MSTISQGAFFLGNDETQDPLNLSLVLCTIASTFMCISLFQLLCRNLCLQCNMLHFLLFQALSAGITCFVVFRNYLRSETVNLPKKS